MGQGRIDGLSVGRGAETIDDDVALHGVGVIETGGADRGDTRNGSRLALGGFQEVANLDGVCLNDLTIDVEVVAFGELNSTHCGLELDKGSLSIGIFVREHKHFAVFVGTHAHVVTNLWRE